MSRLSSRSIDSNTRPRRASSHQILCRLSVRRSDAEFVGDVIDGIGGIIDRVRDR
jgi:hypothetical protein